MIAFNPCREGTKKYSPPRGTTKLGIANCGSGFNGSRPDIDRGPWPVIASTLIQIRISVSTVGEPALTEMRTQTSRQPCPRKAGSPERLTKLQSTIFRPWNISSFKFHQRLTLLQLLKPINETALVTDKEQTSAVLRDSGGLLVYCQLWRKWNSSAHDATWFNRDGLGAVRWYLKIIARVCPPNVGCERALEL